MEFLKTQIGQVREQVKQAMLAHIPVVYIPTAQMEVIQELLYGKDCIDSLVPRVCSRGGKVVKLKPEEIGEVDSTTGMFKSILDNYKVGMTNLDATRVPSLFVSYITDWNSISSSVKNFIALYLGIKKGENQVSPLVADAMSRSLYIVASSKEEPIPAAIAPYAMTVRIPPLCDEEIEAIIAGKLAVEGISMSVVPSQLLSQMIISFRGLSANKIKQLLSLMIAEQSIDFGDVDTKAVLKVIRLAKKQMLDNRIGLKWEKTTVSGIAGLDSITEWLQARKAIFADPELARRQHMDIPNGVLVSGIPGSGKSLMAKTAATILNMPLISLDMGALLGGLMGESEHNMIDALAMAEQMAPCVLWIDEIEKAFSGSSQQASSSDGGVGRRMFGKFLTWMQEKSAACFVFATSNDISCLPPELFRSERFDRKFFTFMPTASECSRIFAANIKAQNKAYQEELAHMPSRLRHLQAKQMFASALEDEEVWLKVINDCCTSDPDACVLKEVNEGKVDGQEAEWPVFSWSTKSRPRNKLMTGADISSLLKEAKFQIYPEPQENDTAVIYSEQHLTNAVRTILKTGDFKPYGETNLKDIVACFLKLHENQFIPASGQCILDFECYDADRGIYVHDPHTAKHWENNYDKVLYYTLVGAINHYAKKLRNI